MINVQLAEKFNGVLDFCEPMYSRKFDGKRMYIENGVAYSRQNKPCNVAPIEHILKQLPMRDDIVWDGEVIYFDEDFNDDFKKTISCTQSKKRKPECDNLYYVIFDNAISGLEFSWTYSVLCDFLDADYIPGRYDLMRTKYPNILIACQCNDLHYLQDMPQASTFEGYMVREGDEKYIQGRTKNLLKIKQFKDTELIITGFTEGLGKYVGTLGALIVDYNGNSVNVGGGFLDSERAYIWEHKKELLGKLCKVKYFQEEKNSLRFPTFLCIMDNNKQEISLE